MKISRRAALMGVSAVLARPAAAFVPQKTIHLTFDDGPHPVTTHRLLDVLGIYGMKATFFVLGTRVQESPGLLDRILSGGHQIGNHGWSHRDMIDMSDSELIGEIARTNAIIRDKTRVEPRLFRPPYGSISTSQRQVIQNALGMDTVLWDVDTEDWKHPGTSQIIHSVIKNSREGSIVLMHDVHVQTLEASPYLFAEMLRSGVRSASLF